MCLALCLCFLSLRSFIFPLRTLIYHTILPSLHTQTQCKHMYMSLIYNCINALRFTINMFITLLSLYFCLCLSPHLLSYSLPIYLSHLLSSFSDTPFSFSSFFPPLLSLSLSLCLPAYTASSSFTARWLMDHLLALTSRQPKNTSAAKRVPWRHSGGKNHTAH